MTTDESPTRSVLDVRSLITERFNGRVELYRLLTRNGHNIDKRSIDKWIDRNSVPGKWWPVLHELCEKQGQSLDLSRYRREKPDDSIF